MQGVKATEGLCAVPTQARKQCFFPVFPSFSFVRQPPVASCQPFSKFSKPGAQLALTDVLISLGQCTKFDCDISAWQAVYQARRQQPIGNPWP